MCLWSVKDLMVSSAIFPAFLHSTSHHPSPPTMSCVFIFYYQYVLKSNFKFWLSSIYQLILYESHI
jgi:hypothetical protein